MLRTEGYTLLELLMVLAVIGAIVTFSVRHFYRYRQTTNVALVKNDIAVIQDALNRYFHQTGCNQTGAFSGNLNPSITDLGLKSSQASRSPIITQYTPIIIDTHTTTKNDKPVYRLAVQATLNSSYSYANVLWLSQVLHAGSHDGDTLTWSTLPRVTAANDSLWVANANRAFYRTQQSDNTIASESYCAN